MHIIFISCFLFFGNAYKGSFVCRAWCLMALNKHRDMCAGLWLLSLVCVCVCIGVFVCVCFCVCVCTCAARVCFCFGCDCRGMYDVCMYLCSISLHYLFSLTNPSHPHLLHEPLVACVGR